MYTKFYYSIFSTESFCVNAPGAGHFDFLFQNYLFYLKLLSFCVDHQVQEKSVRSDVDPLNVVKKACKSCETNPGTLVPLHQIKFRPLYYPE